MSKSEKDFQEPAGEEGKSSPATPGGTDSENVSQETEGSATEAPTVTSSESVTADSANATQEIAEENTDEIIGRLGDELSRAKADVYNLNNEYQNYVRRSKTDISSHYQNGKVEVIEAILPVLDDIDAARKHGDLAEGPFAAIAKKLETTLENRFSIVRFGEAGEVFDPQIHEALMANESSDVTEPTISQVLQPGYKIGDRVIRATKVMVSNPA